MSEQFYYILINSLLITAGVFILYLLYRYFVSGINEANKRPRFIQVQEPHHQKDSGRLIFNLEIPVEEELTCFLADENENSISVLMEKQSKQGLANVVVETKELKPGVYYFKLTTNRQVISRKFKV